MAVFQQLRHAAGPNPSLVVLQQRPKAELVNALPHPKLVHVDQNLALEQQPLVPPVRTLHDLRGGILTFGLGSNVKRAPPSPNQSKYSKSMLTKQDKQVVQS